MTSAAPAAASASGSAPALRLRPVARRRPALAAVSAVLFLGSTAAVAAAFSHAQATTAVLAVRTRLAPGDTISANDLQVVHVHVAGGDVATVPASAEASVVGRRAVGELPAGALLAPADTARRYLPPPGSAVVGVAAAPGALPAGGVRVGDEVDIVATGSGAPAGSVGGTSPAAASATPASSATSTSELGRASVAPSGSAVPSGSSTSSAVPAGVVAGPATVVAVAPTAASGGGLVVSVVVPLAVAPGVAALSSSGTAALVVVGAGT